MVQAERIAGLRQPRQLVIMRREQAAGAQGLVHRLDHRPGQRHPVIGRGPASDLVEDHERTGRRLREDRRGLDHLDHEGRAPARQIVRSADPAEQAVGDADLGAGRRHETPCLRQQQDQRVLAQEGRFAAHIGPADQPQPVVLRQHAIIGDEALIAARQGLLDHRVAPGRDGETGLVDQFGPAPAALDGAFGEAGGDIDPR